MPVTWPDYHVNAGSGGEQLPEETGKVRWKTGAVPQL